MSLVLSCGSLKAGDTNKISSRKRLALVLEYDGTNYAGSQRQAHAPTIQACLEEALAKLLGIETPVSLAGRTDAGAHARGQVASFSAESDLPLKAYIYGLNSFLPTDIAVKEARFVAEDFDPQRQALAREYEYLILNSVARLPLWHNRAYQVPGKLNVDLMNDAAANLVGIHDFASFSGDLEEDKSTVRHIFKAHCQKNDELITFTVTGNAFLPHQVRITAGMLIRVGQERLSVPDFKTILDAHQPCLAGPTAPACGLYLNKVVYNEENDENV